MTLKKTTNASQTGTAKNASGITSPFDVDENSVAVNFFTTPADKVWIEERAREWKASQSKILRWCVQCGIEEYEKVYKKRDKDN
jgi:hypothetical protein